MTRRHHNNRGERQVRRGKTRIQVAHMARRLLKHGCPGCQDADGPTEHAEWCKGWPKAWKMPIDPDKEIADSLLRSGDAVRSGRERLNGPH